MTDKVRDRLAETSTTTGTGTMSLSGTAVTGCNKLNWALITGDTFWYFIEGVTVPGEFEVGIGTFTSGAPDTVARTVVYDSSAGLNTAVSFSAGTKNIHLCASSEQLKCLVTVAGKSGNQTGLNYTTASGIVFDQNTLSTPILGSFHSTSVNTTRMRLDSTYMAPSYIKLSGQVGIANITATDWIDVQIMKNGTTSVARHLGSAITTSPCVQVVSPIMKASLTDYFELFLQVQSDTAIDIVAAQTWFQLEALQ